MAGSGAFPEPQPEYDELQREATRLKDRKDYEGAIRCLMVAKAIAGEHEDVGRALRLPVVLALAGRMPEAEAAFARILAAVPQRVARNIPREIDRLGIEHAEYSKIYNQMRVVFKRAGRTAEADRYGELSAQHYDSNQAEMNLSDARLDAEIARQKASRQRT